VTPRAHALHPRQTAPMPDDDFLSALASLSDAKAASVGAPLEHGDEESPPVSAVDTADLTAIQAERYASLSAVLPNIQEGQTIHLVHHGGFSCEQLILAMVDRIGPAHLRAATWVVSRIPAYRIVKANRAGHILSARFILDVRENLYQPQALDILATAFGRESVRMTELHSKAYWLENDSASIAIIGSANLSENPRIEILTVTSSKDIGGFWRNWFESQWKRSRKLDSFKPFEGAPKAKRSMTVLRGIPGSGKTYWRERNCGEEWIVLSRDDFMTNPITGQYQWNADDEIRYRKKRSALVRTAAETRKAQTLVIDDTHVHRASFEPDVIFAKAANVDVLVVRISTPLEVCLARQTHGVPEDVVRRMAAEFEDFPGEEIVNG
jgi:predicted kinase